MTYSLLHGLATYPYAAANKSLGFGALLSSLKTSNQYASSIASILTKISMKNIQHKSFDLKNIRLNLVMIYT